MLSRSRGLKRPELRSLLLILLLIAIIASFYMAQEVQIRQPLTNFSVVPRPFLNYSTMEFKQVSMVRDVWNESFEYPTSSQNHYWHSGVGTVTGGATSLNDTLDPGFEEVSSTSSNPNVNLPSWFAIGDFNDATVRVRRLSTLSYDQTYSALVETRYTNTSAIDYEFTWETPITVYDSCGYDGDNLPDNTIDDSTTSQWEHDETETHWIIYDLNQSYVVRAVRVYCGTYRLKDVNVYVSDNPSDFGQPVVELWDPPSSGWNVSPEFIKKGRYIKLEFDTTRSDGWLYNAFYEFDAKIQTTIKGHVKGGIKTIDDYFVKTAPVNLYENPIFSLYFLVDEADPGSGSCDAYYLRIELGLNNESTILSIIYIVPVTPVGSPSPSHFTNTTTEKYIYGASTVSTLDAWTSLSRNVTSDYQSLWGTLDNATIVWIRIENDLYNPVTDSESNGPIMKVYYDAASLVISTDEEELPNGSFEAPGWRLIQSNKMSSLNYTKDSSESMDGTTSYYMDVTSDTSGTESGSTFSVTKHCVVGIDESSFIREANDSQTLRIHAYIKVVSMANVSNTLYSFVGLRVRFKELEFPYDTYDLYYCIMLRGSPPSGSSSEKYIELVKSTNLQTGVWYGITRNPMADGGWTNVKIVQIGMVVALYFGSTSSTEEVNVVARYDQIQLLLSTGTSTLEETGLAERSTTYTLHGNYSLKLNATQGYSFAGYETGAENENNTYYVAFPKYLNFSAYYLIESYSGDITIQISLGIDDGPVYGDGYLWELIYYYGSPSGVSPIFSPSVSTEIIQISPSVTTSTWVRLLRNWTLDLPESWTYYNPRVEAVGLKVWCSGEASTYWDLVAFYGAWKGVRKVIELESRNDLYVRKLNVTDFWTVSGDQPGGVNDFVDNRSNVDNSPDVGEHSNFTAMKHGPDYVYDVLTEGYRELYSSQDYVDRRSDVDGRPDRGTHSNFTAMQYGPDFTYDVLTEANTNPPPNDIEDYVDQTSNVDGSPDKGTHGNFTAMQYGPDSIFDVLAEEDRGPGNDSQNYVDQMSNEDGSPDRGTHSNFTAMQYGPDSTYDVLTEEDTNPPPNDVEDYVDQTSDVDDSPDIGTHGNFTAMQYGPDSTFDVLTEEDTSPPMIIIRDYIDNNSSDVDSSPNIGHFTNFTAMKHGPDSDSDTLVEEIVEGEEYEFYYTDTMVNTQAGSTYVTAVQLTFQPEETGYFLIMGYLETRSTSINSLVSVELQVDSTQYCYQNYKYKDGAAPDWNPFTGIIRLELDNATTHTVRIRFKGSAGTQYA